MPCKHLWYNLSSISTRVLLELGVLEVCFISYNLKEYQVGANV